MKFSEVVKAEIAGCDSTNPKKIRKYLIDKIGAEVAIKEIKRIQAEILKK